MKSSKGKDKTHNDSPGNGHQVVGELYRRMTGPCYSSSRVVQAIGGLRRQHPWRSVA